MYARPVSFDKASRTVTIGKHRYVLPFKDDIPISPEDRAALKRSIQKDGGILEPIVVWAKELHANTFIVIDGANRVEIAAELNLPTVPRRLIDVADQDAARRKCRVLNLHRRHLTRDEKRRLVRDLLAEEPEQSDRAIAGVAGVSPTTVADQRQQMEEAGEIDAHDARTGIDGRVREIPISTVQTGQLTEGNSVDDADASGDVDDEQEQQPEQVPEQQIPERLKLIFAAADTFRSMARAANRLANAVTELEASPEYKAAFRLVYRGDPPFTSQYLSHIRTLATQMRSMTAMQLCPGCKGKGEYKGPCGQLQCSACKGRGFVSKDDLDRGAAS